MGAAVNRIVKCRYRKREFIAGRHHQLCLHPQKGGLCSYNGNNQSYHCKYFAQREEKEGENSEH